MRRQWKAYLLLAVMVALVAGWGMTALREMLQREVHDRQLDVYRMETIAAHQRAAGQWQAAGPRGPVVLGDSITAGLYGPNLMAGALVLGMGRDRVADLRDRIPRYGFLTSAPAVVLAVGVNDLLADGDIEDIAAEYGQMLDELADIPGLWVSLVLPVTDRVGLNFPGMNNQKIDDFNRLIAKLCLDRPRCAVIDAGPDFRMVNGQVLEGLHEGDGLHLSRRGYEVWANALRKSLEPAMRSE